MAGYMPDDCSVDVMLNPQPLEEMVADSGAALSAVFHFKDLSKDLANSIVSLILTSIVHSQPYFFGLTPQEKFSIGNSQLAPLHSALVFEAQKILSKHLVTTPEQIGSDLGINLYELADKIKIAKYEYMDDEQIKMCICGLSEEQNDIVDTALDILERVGHFKYKAPEAPEEAPDLPPTDPAKKNVITRFTGLAERTT